MCWRDSVVGSHISLLSPFIEEDSWRWSTTLKESKQKLLIRDQIIWTGDRHRCLWSNIRALPMSHRHWETTSVVHQSTSCTSQPVNYSTSPLVMMVLLPLLSLATAVLAAPPPMADYGSEAEVREATPRSDLIRQFSLIQLKSIQFKSDLVFFPGLCQPHHEQGCWGIARCTYDTKL